MRGGLDTELVNNDNNSNTHTHTQQTHTQQQHVYTHTRIHAPLRSVRRSPS